VDICRKFLLGIIDGLEKMNLESWGDCNKVFSGSWDADFQKPSDFCAKS
jgi:hypothetical protein